MEKLKKSRDFQENILNHVVFRRRVETTWFSGEKLVEE